MVPSSVRSEKGPRGHSVTGQGVLSCELGEGELSGQAEPYTDQSRPWKFPSFGNKVGWKNPLPGSILHLAQRPCELSPGQPQRPVPDALKLGVSQAPNGLLQGFSCVATSGLFPSSSPPHPPSCLRAPPASPACLTNPCLTVARETASLATSPHPYDKCAGEGTASASLLGLLQAPF